MLSINKILTYLPQVTNIGIILICTCKTICYIYILRDFQSNLSVKRLLFKHDAVETVGVVDVCGGDYMFIQRQCLAVQMPHRQGIQ